MSEQDKNELKDIEIEPLSDEELESVAGGLAAASDSCCCTTGGGAAAPTNRSNRSRARSVSLRIGLLSPVESIGRQVVTANYDFFQPDLLRFISLVGEEAHSWVRDYHATGASDLEQETSRALLLLREGNLDMAGGLRTASRPQARQFAARVIQPSGTFWHAGIPV